MKNKSFTSIWGVVFIGMFIAGVFLLGAVGDAVACKSAGPNKHVGGITAINTEVSTFTIRDAETDHLMTFEASDEILTKLQVKDRVIITYKEKDDKMVAVEVQS